MVDLVHVLVDFGHVFFVSAMLVDFGHALTDTI